MDSKSSHASPLLDDPAAVKKPTVSASSNVLPYSTMGKTFSSDMHVNVQRKKSGVIDDIRTNGWLDAMKASSPPRTNSTKDMNLEGVLMSDESDDRTYDNWMVPAYTFFQHRDAMFFDLYIFSRDAEMFILSVLFS